MNTNPVLGVALLSFLTLSAAAESIPPVILNAPAPFLNVSPLVTSFNAKNLFPLPAMRPIQIPSDSAQLIPTEITNHALLIPMQWKDPVILFIDH